MNTKINTETTTRLTSKRPYYWKGGITGSLIGGLIFGMMMAMIRMLPIIAGMVGSTSPGIGFSVHMLISLIFGITFTVFAAVVNWNSIISGIVFGIILWILFPFIMMPIMMGMAQMAFKFTPDAMMSLVGHLIYGFVTGIVYQIIAKQSIKSNNERV